jgi:hypothetical protein
MPVEIKELVIRTVVGKAATPDSGAASDPRSAAGSGERGEMERVVQECVRQVMRILAKDRER